ncbi:MAG: TonB-dependent receptor [Methylocystaceae bacterium]|nr:MAG: TonB-dependent receptor [Methylocystaceae bacterium]
MQRRRIGAVLFNSVAFAAGWDDPAHSQTALPDIVIAAPSPIRRRAETQPKEAEAPAPAETEVARPGTLAVVTGEFATVTLVTGEELRRSPGATLGDVLFAKPGITGSSFAPGASRPIVRGLDAYRVRVQENGVGSGGVSELGEDHGVPVDPLGVGRLEVVRGPATLRWGSQAIGGVVNATNNRIPDASPCRDEAPAATAAGPCARLETRSAISTVDDGLESATLLDAGQGNFAIHADAHGRRASDAHIPAYPYLFPPDPPPIVLGRQPNSYLRSGGGSFGGSYIFDRGFFGVAITKFDSVYRIPGIEATETRTRIDMRQTRVSAKGEYRPPSSFIEAVRFWAGVTDYKHHELAAENGFDGIQQTFANKEQEGRIEVQLAPVDLRFAALSSAFGAQAAHQRLTASGADGGLFDPNRTTSVAGFLFNELKFTDTLRFQVAGRIEQVRTTGSTPNLFADPSVAFRYDRDFMPKSVAAGLLQNLPFDMVASLTAQHVERAPRGPELFSRGVHEATGTFDIGNPHLGIEAAKTVEIGLRRARGPFRFEAAIFYTRFHDFIFRRLTGETCEGDFAGCTPGGAGGDLSQAVYAQRDAIFRGGELQSQWDVAPLSGGVFGVENQFDVVRATFTDGSNVPRIPPVRLGGGVFWRDGHWLARVNLLHAFPQNDVAAIAETRTGGYNLLKAEISYTTRLKPSDFPAREVTVGVVGDNLLNADIRNSVSYKKDEAPLPGANMRLFANFIF